MRTCRGFKNEYILHLAGSAVGHSEKFDAEISSRFLPTCTHILRLKVGRNLHIDMVFNRGEFETGKHVMLSTRV